MKKIAVLFVLLVVLTSAAFTSGQEEGASEPDPNRLDTWIADEPTTFSMLFADRTTSPLQEDWLVIEEIARRANVYFEFITAPDNDYDTKLQLVLNSGDIPDIVTKIVASATSTQIYREFASNGVLLPVSDYADRMPHMLSYIEERNADPVIDRMRMRDGKFYLYPAVAEYPIQDKAWTMRLDVLEEHGLEVPESYPEILEVLGTLKEIYPESTPISARWKGDFLLAMVAANMGITGGWASPWYFDEEHERWRYSRATETHRIMLEWLHSFMEEGILDREAFIQDNSQFDQKRWAKGQVYLDVDWVGGGMDGVNNQMKVDFGIEGANWQPILPPESPVGTRYNYPTGRFRYASASPASVVSEPYFDKLIQFMDWMNYSHEGMEIANWGVEGETFIRDEDGNRRFMDHISRHGFRGPEQKNLKEHYGLGDSRFSVSHPTDFTFALMPDEIAELVQTQADMGALPPLDPPLRFDTMEEEELKIVETPLRDYARTMELKFIYGEEDISDDAVWANYLKAMQDKGLERVEGILNSAWERQ